jgi:hypothetical protein
MVIESGSVPEVLLCDLDANPRRIVDGRKAKRSTGPQSEVEAPVRYNGAAAGPTT